MAARGCAAARLLGLRFRILRGGHGCLSVMSVVCCQIEVSESGRSFVQRSPTEFGVSECDHDASIMRGQLPTGDCCAMQKKKKLI